MSSQRKDAGRTVICVQQSGVMIWRSRQKCKSQDKAKMDETTQSEHSRCVFAAWRRMLEDNASSQQNVSTTSRWSRVSAHASQRVRFESRSASAGAADTHDLCRTTPATIWAHLDCRECKAANCCCCKEGEMGRRMCADAENEVDEILAASAVTPPR